MRRLLLMRHAKAERGHAGQRDHERTLAERGRHDAPQVGSFIARHGLGPDHVIVSTAARTRETWMLAASALKGKKPKVEFEQRVYDAEPETLLQLVKETGASVQTLLMVGHNPGMHELATMLSGTGDIEARRILREKFPTSGLAVIDFPFDRWDAIHPQSGRLAHFITPRSIAGDPD